MAQQRFTHHHPPLTSPTNNILVRLPNWLGDMVMSLGFINALQQAYPNARISVIAKKGLEGLLHFFPSIHQSFIFSKSEWPGLNGSFRFGKSIRNDFDIFFSLPDSFSAAVMGWGTGAKTRVGFKKELRSFLLTDSYTRPTGLHRVEEYVSLLTFFGAEATARPVVRFRLPHQDRTGIAININSEASSRRLPAEKAASLVRQIAIEWPGETLTLIGGPADTSHVNEVLSQLSIPQLQSVCGKTSLPQLVELLSRTALVITTDSGPAHLANAAGAPTVVIFGAGNENNTAPYQKENLRVVRLGELPCEPCVNNVCKLYGTPKCLTDLQNEKVLATAREIFF